jgi:signal transduction histidine kinase
MAPNGVAEGSFSLLARSPIVRVLERRGDYLSRRDLDVLPQLQAVSSEERQMLESAEVALLVPMKSRGHLTGVLALGAKASGEGYSQEDIGLLVTVTHAASAHIENARLYAEERQRAERLQELDRMKTDFLAIVSHQLKTPITSIKAAIGMLGDMEEASSPGPRGRLMASLGRGADALESLVNNLLDFARVKSARVHLDLEVLDLAEVVQDAAAVVASAVRAKEQTMVVDSHTPLPPVLVDRTRMEQVLLNLLSNANRYTPEGGSITVYLRQQDDQVLVEVRDSCGGIPSEDQEWVFEAYRRPRSQSPASAASGTGLGLAIAKSLVELHNGRIWLESRPGEGCSFIVALPAHRAEETRDRIQQAENRGRKIV